MAKFQVGDRVAYSANFLRSIGMVTGDMGHARGTITELCPLGRGSKPTILARIAWEKGAGMPERVNVFNLAKVGANRRFCAVG